MKSSLIRMVTNETIKIGVSEIFRILENYKILKPAILLHGKVPTRLRFTHI